MVVYLPSATALRLGGMLEPQAVAHGLIHPLSGGLDGRELRGSESGLGFGLGASQDGQSYDVPSNGDVL